MSNKASLTDPTLSSFGAATHTLHQEHCGAAEAGGTRELLLCAEVVAFVDIPPFECVAEPKYSLPSPRDLTARWGGNDLVAVTSIHAVLDLLVEPKHKYKLMQ